MTRYILSRLVQTVPVFVVISILVFLVSHLAPGDPITNSLQGQVPQDAIDEIRRSYGLDRPVYVQYIDWVRNIFTGNWGISIGQKVPVFDVLGPAFVNTLILTTAAVFVCVVFGVAIGVWSGVHNGSFADRITMGLIQIGHNLPVFWLGLLLIWVFGVTLDWLPVSGMHNARNGGGLGDLLEHLILPSISAALISMLILARLVRSTTIDIMNSDYIRTYRSQGFSRRTILRRHVARNVLSPVVNVTGLQIGYLLSGVVFVEAVFAWPGIGSQLYNAVASQDYPMIQVGVMLVTGCFLVVNLLTDIVLDALNPRLRR